MKKLLYLSVLFTLLIVMGCEKKVDTPTSTNPPIVSLEADSVAVANVKYLLKAVGQSAYGGPQLSKVEFYKGEEKIGEKTVAPYTFEYQVKEVVPGEQLSFHVMLIDEAGNKVKSNSVKATVKVLPIKIEAENATLKGVAIVATDQATKETSSNQAKVGGIDNADSGIDATIEILSAGNYVIRVVAGTGFDNTSHEIFIDGKRAEAQIYNISNKGWNVWQTHDLIFHLEAGTHTVSIRHKTGFGELDYFEYSKQ